MLRNCQVLLKNRPYFGGIECSDQIRSIRELEQWEGKKIIVFNRNCGAEELYRLVSPPFKSINNCWLKAENNKWFKTENDCWYILVERIGTYFRSQGDIALKLCKYSVVPYENGDWEKERCLIKTHFSNPQKVYIKRSYYQPQYY
jgi:hypothetical protein